LYWRDLIHWQAIQNTARPNTPKSNNVHVQSSHLLEHLGHIQEISYVSWQAIKWKDRKCL